MSTNETELKFEKSNTTLKSLIKGDLHPDSLIFLDKLISKNQFALNKIITKLKPLKNEIYAFQINTIVKSITESIKLPDLLKSVTNIDSEYPELLKKITQEIKDSPLVQVILHMINTLNLLPEAQTLHLIVALLISNYESSLSAGDELPLPNVIAKRILSGNCINEKSDLARLITIIAERLYFSLSTVKNQSRQMYLSELFFLFDDLNESATNNPQLMQHINAIMLILSVYKLKIANVSYDLFLYRQKNNPTSLDEELYSLLKEPLTLNLFFDSQEFEHYFGKNISDQLINRNAFLGSLAYYALSSSRKKSRRIYLKLNNLIEQSKNMHRLEFQCWFMQMVIENDIITTELLDIIEQESAYHLKHVASLVFTANKLVSLGFSPRSSSVAATGHFQPLINSTAPRTDANNIKAFKNFHNNLNLNLQKKLAVEILAAILIQQRITCINTKPIETKEINYKQKPRIGIIYKKTKGTHSRRIKAHRAHRIARKQHAYSYSYRFFDETKLYKKPKTFKLNLGHNAASNAIHDLSKIDGTIENS